MTPFSEVPSDNTRVERFDTPQKRKGVLSTIGKVAESIISPFTDAVDILRDTVRSNKAGGDRYTAGTVSTPEDYIENHWIDAVPFGTAVKGAKIAGLAMLPKISRYGMSVPGSKNKIARDIIEQMPAGDTFVDMMSGGGAIADAASRSGKYKKIISVELDPEKLAAQKQMFYGRIPDISELHIPSTIEQFKQLPPLDKNLLSFGGNLRDRVNIASKDLESRLGRLREVNALKNDRTPIEFVNSDYRDFKFPSGDVIAYYDPPYRGTTGYKFPFNPEEFDEFVMTHGPSRSYVSEYTLPKEIYDVIWDTDKLNLLGTQHRQMRKELLGKVRK